MTRDDEQTALLLDREIDAEGRNRGAGDEVAELVDVVRLLRRHPSVLREGEGGTLPHRLWRTWAGAAAAALLLAALSAGLIIARPGAERGRAASGALRACLASARLVGGGAAALPPGAVSWVVNQARQAGDPCPPRPVLWARTRGKPAGLQFGAGARSGYVFELTGRFYLNPLRPGRARRHLWLYWTPKASGGQFAPVRLGQGAVHRSLLRPGRPLAHLPARIVRALTAGRAGSPVSYAVTTLTAARATTGLALWPFLPGSRRAYVLRLSSGGRTRDWIAVEARPRVLVDRRLADGPARRLLARGASSYWLGPLPSRLPGWFRGDIDLNANGTRRTSVSWVVTTAGRLFACDPYQQALPEETPPSMPVFLAVIERGGHQSFWLTGTEHDKTLSASGGSPLSGLRLSRLGRVHRFAAHALGHRPRPGSDKRASRQAA